MKQKKHTYYLAILLVIIPLLLLGGLFIVYRKQMLSLITQKTGGGLKTSRATDINACSNEKACINDPGCQCYCSIKCGFRNKEYGKDDPRYRENDPAGYYCYCKPWDVDHYEKCNVEQAPATSAAVETPKAPSEQEAKK